MPAIRTCNSCNQEGHSRITSRLCPNNHRAVTCTSCGNIGHRRATHRDCPNYVANRTFFYLPIIYMYTQSNTVYSIEPQFNSMDVDERTETINIDLPTTDDLICSSCGQTGHLRSSNRRCVNYVSRTREVRQLSTYNMARRGTPSFTERHDLSEMDQMCNHCQARMWTSEKNGGTVSNPNFSLCCGKGKYVLNPLPETPNLILDLLKGTNDHSKEFRRNIRA